ncbi:MAG: ABC transporter substrate-binding protein, partial [Phaeodactylibacter sp.]|nr:ABC transporter substrate-binding protein [Phaeodactylibacter sp.]
MAKRLTTFSKFLITLVIVAAIFLGGKWVLDNTEFGQNLLNQAKSDGPEMVKKDSKKSGAGDDDVLKVQIFTWGGYAPGLYFNEGAEPSERSRFYQDYGLKVKFELIDDFDGSRQAWKADEVHLLGNETGAMNTEMEGLAPYDPKIVLQCDWSRGGDAVVVRRDITNVNDLKGKKIAYAGFTPSVTFLVYMLESAGLSINDVEPVEVPLPTDAANAFIGGQVAAAIVWSPDDEKCVREVAGARVLQSTKEASNIIADVYMAKDEYVKANKDKIDKFYEGWMIAAAEINSVPSNKDKAARILAEVTGIPVPDALSAINNVRLTTQGDNMNYFGLNLDYKGMTGEQLYTKMGSEFEALGQAPASRPSWRQLAYPNAARSANAKLTGSTHRAEGAAEFKPVTEETKAKPAISKKLVSINFETGQFELDPNAKTIIDLQFASILKSYGNTRIRIEGNTDNVGSKSSNKA